MDVDTKLKELMDLLEQNQTEEALEEVRKLLAEHDDSSRVWLMEAQVRALLDEEQAALRAFDRALALAPDDPLPLLEKGRYLVADEDPEEALELADKALELAEAPEMLFEINLLKATALHVLALDLHDGQDEEEIEEEQVLTPEQTAMCRQSIEALEGARRHHPDSVAAWTLEALVRQTLDDFQGAVSAARSAVDLDRDNGDAWHLLGLLLAASGRMDEAGEALREVHELDNGPDAPPLANTPEKFLKIARDVWDDLADELADEYDEFDLDLEIQVEDAPSLAEVVGAEMIDPRSPGKLDFGEDEDEEEDVPILTLFQRNIERDLRDLADTADDTEDLREFIAAVIVEFMMDATDMEEEVHALPTVH